MSHFAKVENGIVTQVIVADQEFIDSGVLHGTWVQTSYNTHAGEYTKGQTKHERDANKQLGTDKDKKARDRKNYAGIGYTYDPNNDAFYPPTPYPSWKLNKDIGCWEAPKQKPQDNNSYEWNEKLKEWEVINII